MGAVIGGKWLGGLLSIGGMASMMGIFIAVLLSVSRVPAVMGNDRLLPTAFSRMHSKFQTPYISIIVCAIVVSLLVLWPLSDLLVVDISLYAAGISLEFIALIHLRKKASQALRPFKIPLQKRGLILLFILPAIIFAIALGGAMLGQAVKAALFAIGAICSAHFAWLIASKRKNFIAHQKAITEL